MPPSEPIEPFVTFFKALADGNRLRIVGLLAHQPQSVEELAANLGVSSATVSHHLQRLRRADLVEARVQSYYNVYALRADVLRQMAERLLTLDSLKATAPVAALDTYSAQVLGEYFARGRLKAMPRQLKKREAILRRLAAEFEPGKRYSAGRIDAILKAFYADPAALRRELVDAKLLARDGGYYRRCAP
jgi:DNA-binding transcriptional ArsR family regulator